MGASQSWLWRLQFWWRRAAAALSVDALPTDLRSMPLSARSAAVRTDATTAAAAARPYY